jgi:hypothetical protein
VGAVPQLKRARRNFEGVVPQLKRARRNFEGAVPQLKRARRTFAGAVPRIGRARCRSAKARRQFREGRLGIRVGSLAIRVCPLGIREGTVVGPGALTPLPFLNPRVGAGKDLQPRYEGGSNRLAAPDERGDRQEQFILVEGLLQKGLKTRAQHPGQHARRRSG